MVNKTPTLYKIGKLIPADCVFFLLFYLIEENASINITLNMYKVKWQAREFVRP